MIMTAPTTNTGTTSSGGRLVSADGRALPLRHVHLAAEAAGGIARVTLTQRFFNPHEEPLEVLSCFIMSLQQRVSCRETSLSSLSPGVSLDEPLPPIDRAVMVTAHKIEASQLVGILRLVWRQLSGQSHSSVGILQVALVFVGVCERFVEDCDPRQLT